MGESGSGDYRVINVRELEGLTSPSSFMSSDQCCIFKVPNILYRHDPNAYLPNAFSIGPLHRHQQHLKAIEEIKVQYFYGLISRNNSQTRDRTRHNLIQAVSEVEVRTRLCYSVTIDFTAEELVSILVLDGCFIIELFIRDAARVNGDNRNKQGNDPVFDMACMLQFLNHDLILLENQIPWFVLECLFTAAFPGSDNPPPSNFLTGLAFQFFGGIFSKAPPAYPINNGNGSKHILDLLRNTLVSTSQHTRGRIYNTWKLIPSATSLDEAGIKFWKGKSGNILNINFEDGVLEIPPLVIQETTSALFRNLIAFEQCYLKCSPNITSYAILLNNLIASTKDISVLREEEIIDNWLNVDDCFQFFSKLYHDTYVKEFYYTDLCIDVSDYCRRCWPRWRAAYVHNHFSKPWVIISEVVGATALAFSFLQVYAAFK